MDEPAVPLPEENPFANLGAEGSIPEPPPEVKHQLGELVEGVGEVAGEVIMEGAFEVAAAGIEGAASVVGAIADGADAAGCLAEGCAGCFSVSVVLVVLTVAASAALAATW